MGMLDAVKEQVQGSESDMIQYDELFGGLNEKLEEKVVMQD